MTPLAVSGPAATPHRRGKSRRGFNALLSFPVFLIVLCGIASLPPVNAWLLAFDAALHAHNDAIVKWIMYIVPAALLMLGAIGIWAVFFSKPVPEPMEEFDPLEHGRL